MSEGTLYPALKRLETQGSIHSYWVVKEGPRPQKYWYNRFIPPHYKSPFL